jgi:hypothetical protein
LKEASLKLSLKLNPERFITDFESGIIKAVRKEVGRCFYSLKINCVGFFLQKSGAWTNNYIFYFSSVMLYTKGAFFIFYKELTKK